MPWRPCFARRRKHREAAAPVAPRSGSYV